FLRGTGLDTSTPNFYAVSVTRGLQVQLLRVGGGRATVLAQIKSADYVSSEWVKVSLSAKGPTLQVQVSLQNTGKFLTSGGQWQTNPAWALTRTDTAITGVGQVGLARQASTSGTVNFDNFTVIWPVSEENFDHTSAGTIPSGWAQWSTTGSSIFTVANARYLTTPNELASYVPTSAVSGRAWPVIIEPADVEASADVFVNSLIPAQVLVRGKWLDTTTSYYALAVTRGLQVQLLRVVNGYTTVLAQVHSVDYVTNQWIHISLTVAGSTLKAQVYRLDKA